MEGTFTDILSAAASKLLIHFKKCLEDFSALQEVFVISEMIRSIGVIFLCGCCRHPKSSLEKSFGLPKANLEISPRLVCIHTLEAEHVLEGIWSTSYPTDAGTPLLHL